MTRRSSLAPFILALVVGAAACSEPAPMADRGPVFALDRLVTADIADVDPERSDVVPAAVLRLLLQRMLTEHSDLSIEAMRHAVDGGPLDRTLVELTRNTDELTLAIGLVYGPAGAEAFDQLWTNHIEFFNDYAAAVGAGDADATQAAVDSLGHYESDFSSFVDHATSGHAGFEDVLHVLHLHVGQLLEQADAWSAGEHARAYALGAEAHAHMDTIALAIATGISIQQPEAFPAGVDEDAAAECAAAQLEATLFIAAVADRDHAARSADLDAMNAAENRLVGMSIDVVSISDAAEVRSDDPTTRRTDLRHTLVRALDSRSPCATLL